MQKRITVFDTIRGFTMLSMAGFHTCYDLAYLYGWKMPWFTQTIFQDIWRASISWVFLVIAGWMCTLSRNNIKRAAKYAAAALVVWIATTLVSVDDSVNFGIIFCMAACTAIVALARPVLDRVPAAWGITICLIFFACTWSIPKAVYPIPYLAWLGSQIQTLSPVITIRSSHSILCTSQASLPLERHRNQTARHQYGPMRIPSPCSQASDAMHYRSICFISPLYWAYWS